MTSTSETGNTNRAPQAASDSASGTVPGRTPHATLRYTAMRLGVFLACFVVVAVLAYVGVLPEAIGKANPLWLLMLAMVVSAPLSLVLLRRQRDEMSVRIAERMDRAKRKLAANQSQED
ncbi:DUF4229 domain-containing protein [Streptomyces verrucosisporus]|uniref:DUF4229 domain-containing protein n=1 Tax=Streptomyces verrucosisporus TaxID=1695161 RepID=UPI0027DA47AD|nr:DUF4229 domain-containing protein [Streptomyces verrucosisporus]